MTFISKIKDNFNLAKENIKIRKGKKQIEEKYNQMLEQVDEIQKKYTELLEQKGESFDLYIKYQKMCEDMAKERRELKKQLALSNEECNALNEKNDELTKQIKKVERKIKRLEGNK